MSGIEAIVQAFKSASRQACELVLATVVNVRGSAYRGIGARMLVTSDGQWVGSVSGGCLEADVRRQARWVMQTRMPKRVVYQSRAQGDGQDEFALGCEGIIEVLIEPVAPQDPQMQFLETCLAERSEALIATLFASEEPQELALGARLFWRPGVRPSFAKVESPELRAALAAEAPDVWARRKPAVRTFDIDGRAVSACFEIVRPPQALWIFGGGYDAIALVDLAVRVGFRVTVVDPRPGYATRNRFPRAGDLLPSEARVAIERLDAPRACAAVIMNHNYALDLAALRAALPKSLGYLGLLGPKTRAERLLADASADGFHPADGQLAGLFAPVGLDLGAETPEEVALAILAEVKVIFSGRKGDSLRDRNGSIHARIDSKSVSVALSSYPG